MVRPRALKVMRKILTLLISGGILAIVFLLARGSSQPVHSQVRQSVLAESFIATPSNHAIPLLDLNDPAANPLTNLSTLETAAPTYAWDTFSQRVLYWTNVERTQRRLRPLRLNANLINASVWFARDMASRQVKTLSHIDSMGRDTGQRIRAFGYSWTWYGENIAMGYTTPYAVVHAWMNSPGHRANILNPNFTEIGIGHAPGGGAIYWVQDFGRR